MASSLNAQLRVSSEEELHAKLAEAKEELFNLRFQGATGQLESHGRLRAVRKEIARILSARGSDSRLRVSLDSWKLEWRKTL